MDTVTTPKPGARWMAVGDCTDTDSGPAAARTIQSVVAGRDAALVMLFAAPTHDLPALADGAQRAVPDGVPVIGCTTSGEICGLHAGSGRLVVVALGGPGLSVRTSVGMLADGRREAGRNAAQALVGLDRPHQALLLLTEGLLVGRSEIVRGAYGVSGSGVALIGGCAGDGLAMTQTFQLCGGEVLTGAVVGAAIGSDAPIGVGVGHGWRRHGEQVVVTESDGQRIFRLDDEPALDFYLHAVGAAPDDFRNPERWQSITMQHPFGLPRPGGEEVRMALSADYDDRSLLCGDVPQGTVIWLMKGDAESVLAGTRTACRDALAALGGLPPMGLIAFDCISRRNILGDAGIDEEMRTIARCVPGVPVGGFYTYGEFARTSGSRGVHNATLALLALA